MTNRLPFSLFRTVKVKGSEKETGIWPAHIFNTRNFHEVKLAEISHDQVRPPDGTAARWVLSDSQGIVT